MPHVKILSYFNFRVIYVVLESSKKLSIKAKIPENILRASVTRKPKAVRKLVMIWNVIIKIP